MCVCARARIRVFFVCVCKFWCVCVYVCVWSYGQAPNQCNDGKRGRRCRRPQGRGGRVLYRFGRNTEPEATTDAGLGARVPSADLGERPPRAPQARLRRDRARPLRCWASARGLHRHGRASCYAAAVLTASSRTATATLRSFTARQVRRSLSRPGVATSTCTPSRSLRPRPLR